MTIAADTRTQRLAELVSAVLGPIPVGVVVSLAVGVTAGRGWLAGLGWGLLAIAIAAFLPAVVTRSLRGQERTRSQRLIYLVITATFTVVGAIVLLLLDAPIHVIGLELALAAGVLAASITNLWTPASNHVAGLTGGVIIGAMYASPLFCFAAAGIPLLAWSRIALNRHTLQQCLAGAGISILPTAAVCLLVR